MVVLAAADYDAQRLLLHLQLDENLLVGLDLGYGGFLRLFRLLLGLCGLEGFSSSDKLLVLCRTYPPSSSPPPPCLPLWPPRS